jgi:YfiR/HmsC-like
MLTGVLKRQFWSFLFITLMMFTSRTLIYAESDSQRASEYGLKGVYIEKILNYVDWPEENIVDSKESFEMVILGDNPFGDLLDEIFKNSQISGKNINIRYVTNVNLIGSPDIIYISPSMRNQINKLKSALDNRSVFLIGDTEGYGQKGVFLNFYEENEYLRFELNHSALKDAGFEVSFQLVRIAKIVISMDED